VPRALTDEPVVLAAVATAWWLAAGGHVLNGTVFVLDGVFIGAGDFGYLRTWTIVAALVAAVGAQVAATAGAGVLGLWVALEAMMVVRLVSLLVRLRGEGWTRAGDALPAEAHG
jgi:Na+-driven multidrug efflux pump